MNHNHDQLGMNVSALRASVLNWPTTTRLFNMSFVVFPFVSQVVDVVPKCSMVAPPYAFKIAGDGSRTLGL